MRSIVLVCVAVLALSAPVVGATIHVSGIGFPTTETLGGESATGTMDFGGTFTSADYDLQIGEDFFSGTFGLAATTSSGEANQLIYVDPENALTMTAISADGPVSFDANDFVDTAKYGGWEAWTWVDPSKEKNSFGSFTSFSSVPEPGMRVVVAGGLLMLLVFRRQWMRRADRHELAGA